MEDHFQIKQQRKLYFEVKLMENNHRCRVEKLFSYQWLRERGDETTGNALSAAQIKC